MINKLQKEGRSSQSINQLSNKRDYKQQVKQSPTKLPKLNYQQSFQKHSQKSKQKLFDSSNQDPIKQQNDDKQVEKQKQYTQEQQLQQKTHQKLSFKKYQTMSQQMNNQLTLQKALYNRTNTSGMLSRYGGRVFKSMDKIIKQVNNDNISNNKDEMKKSQSQLAKNSKHEKEVQQILSQNPSSLFTIIKQNSQSRQLRKRTRFTTTTSITSMQLRKQLSVNKVFYENPVKKIGYNMQFQSKLRFQHLEQLQQFKLLVEQIQGGDTTKQSPIVSIVYFIKDCEFRPNIITEKNNQIPICVAVIPEYFHSKVTTSNYIRQKYLQRMKSKMNNTYDPEVMSRWPRITEFPEFNAERYNRLLKRFYGTNQLTYNPNWAEHIFRLINYPITPEKKAIFLRQIWQVFNKSNAIFNLDYVLKDPFYIKKFQVSPYLGTRFITSKKIIYHGGYSKELYGSWCNYVRIGKKLLSAKLKKYNLITQSVWTWLQQFDHLIFFQIDFIKILGRPLSIKTFKRLQQRKVQQLKFYLTNTWMRGAMLIYYKNLRLQTDKDEYKDLKYRINQIMKDFVRQLKKKINDQPKVVSKHYLHAIEQKIYQSYCEIWTAVRKQARRTVKSQSQFLPIYGMQNLQIESLQKVRKSFQSNMPQMQLSQLQTPLRIHFASIVQHSLSSLKQLIIINPPPKNHTTSIIKHHKKTQNYSKLKQPIIRLTLIVDRQNIRFREKEDDLIEMFGELIHEIFSLEIGSFGVRYDWVHQERGSVGLGGERARKLTRFFIEHKAMRDDSLKAASHQSPHSNSSKIQQPLISIPYPQVIQTPHQQLPITPNTQPISPFSLSIKYRYAQNHQRQLTQLFSRVHTYYKQAQTILQLFTAYLPFIKLTTSKYIFHQQEDIGRSAEDIFVKDLRIIKQYRQNLNKISSTYHIKIFEINCQQPIRQLNQRMNEVQYLIQQKFMNTLFDNVHEIEKKLVQIKNQLQSCEVKLANVEEVEKKSKNYDLQMKTIHQEVKMLQMRVAFCFSLQKTQTTLVIRFQQLVTKKIQVTKQLKAFKMYLQRAKPQLQQKIINQAQQISFELNQLNRQLMEIEQTQIDIKTIQRILSKLGIYGEKISLYGKKIKQYKQSAQYVLPSNDIDDIVRTYQVINSRYQVVKNLWIGLQQFYSYLNKNLTTKIRQISIIQFSQAVNYARWVVDIYYQHLNTNLKQIQKNKMQRVLIEKFVTDVNRCEEIRMVVEILSNSKVKDRHWDRFGLITVKNVKLKDLMMTPKVENQEHYNQEEQSQQPADDNKDMQSSTTHQQPIISQETVHSSITPPQPKPPTPSPATLTSPSVIETLIRLNQMAQKEDEIQTLYQKIRDSLIQSKLRIIDVIGSDILDTQHSLSILQLLYNSKIELQINLQTKQQSCKFLYYELTKLLDSIDITYQKLNLWIEIEHHYLKLSAYYVQNEEFTELEEFVRFEEVKQLHRKLIKSFDTNNSVYYVGENVGLKIYTEQIQKRLPYLITKLQDTLLKIRLKHPRLCLLNDNQLLSMLSISPNLQKFIIKCFPHLKQVDIKEGAIEKVGRKIHLKFIEPITVSERLGAVKEWMTALEQKMKYTLKQIYKQGSMVTIEKNLNDTKTMQESNQKNMQSDNTKQKQHKPSHIPSTSPQSQQSNYPLQLLILEQHIWFTAITQYSILHSQLNKLFQQICEKIITLIKTNCDSIIVLLYIMFREVISRLAIEDVTSVKDYSWLKEVHVYPLTVTTKSSNPYISVAQPTFIEPQIVIMAQQYQFGWTYYQQPEIFFSNGKVSFHGNTFIAPNNSGKNSLCKYYAQLTGNQMILFDAQPLNSNTNTHGKGENILQKLINYIKLVCHIGGWLFIDGVEEFKSYEELSVLAMCMETVNKTVIQKSTKLNLFGESISLTSFYSRMFLSLESFVSTQSALPSILLQTLRPMFITKPDDFYLLKLFLEARTFDSDKLLEWIRYLTEIQHHECYVKVIIQWIKSEENNRDQFTTKKLLMRLVQNGYSQKLLNLLQENTQNDPNKQQLSSPTSNPTSLQKFLQSEISFLNYQGMIVYGSRNIGKTHQLLSTLQKYHYIYIDMRMYPNKLKTVNQIINEFNSFNPMPEFLLVRDGIEYYQIYAQLKQKSVRIIYVETSLKYIHVSFLNNLKVLNFERLVSKDFEEIQMTRKRSFFQSTPNLSKQIVYKIIGKESYLKIFKTQSPQNNLLTDLDSIIQKTLPSSNIKISFAKLYQSTLQNYKNESIVFLFAIIWSYGQFVTDNVLIQKLQEHYFDQDDEVQEKLKLSVKNPFSQLPKWINTITNWLREGKILSFMDLRPVKCEKTEACTFENNLTVKFEAFSPVCLGDKMYLQLGMLSNISLLHHINPQLPIKIKTKSWLTTILQSITKEFQNINDNVVLLRQSHNFRIDELINRLLYRVKKSKSRFIFTNRMRIIIDDMHLINQKDYKYLEHLAKYKAILYLDDSTHQKRQGYLFSSTKQKNYTNNDSLSYVNHFNPILTNLTLQNCSFTLGTKINPTLLQNQKSFVINFHDHQTQTIFYQFVRVYLTNNYTVDMSVTLLLSMSQQVTKRYQQKDSVYGHYRQIPYYFKDQLQKQVREAEIKGRFWFKNPLFLSIKSQHIKVSQIYEEYLRIVCDMLPQEAVNVKRLHETITHKDRAQRLGLYLVFLIFKLNVMGLQAQNSTTLNEISAGSQCETMSKKSPIYDLTLSKSALQSEAITKLFQTSSEQQESFNPNNFGLTVYNNIPKQRLKSELNEKMKANIIRTYRQLQSHHVILLGDVHTQREKIAKYACRLLRYKMVQFHQQRLLKKLFALSNDHYQDKNFKIVILVKFSDLNGPIIEQMIKIIKQENLSYWLEDVQPASNEMGVSNQIDSIRPSESQLKSLFKKLRFILKLNHSEQSPNTYYSKYPQLSSLFVTLTFPSYYQPIIQQQIEILTSLSEKSLSSKQEFICPVRQKLSWKTDIRTLSEKHSIYRDFLIEFPGLFLHNTQLEYQKLEYYRKIVSQMVINIDRLTSYNNQIPKKTSQIIQICTKINQRKTIIKKNIENLIIQKDTIIEKTNQLNQLLDKTKQNDNILATHVDKIYPTTETKMQKFEKKLDSLDSSDYVKLKYVNKNESGVGLITTLLSYIVNNKLLTTQPQTQKLSSSQQPIQLNHSFSKPQLLSILRQIHQTSKSVIQSPPQQLKGISQQHLTYVIQKMEQLRQMGVKRFEKLGAIWKYLWEWLMAHGERLDVLKEYVDKAKEIALAYHELYGINIPIQQVKYSSIYPVQKSLNPISSQSISQFSPAISPSTTKFKKLQLSPNQSPAINTQDQLKHSIQQKQSILLVSQTDLEQNINEQNIRVTELSEKISNLEVQKNDLLMNQSSLGKYRQFLEQKRINLTRVISSLNDKEYMKSVSSNIASYFRDIPKIAFLKTLSQQRYNQYIDDSIIAGYHLPPEHKYNIFSRDQPLRLFKQKYHLYQMLQHEIQCLFNVINNRKSMVVVQDQERIIVPELIRICGIGLGYEVVQIKRHHKENQLKDVLMKKLRNYHLVLVVLEGTLSSQFPQKQHSQHQQTQNLFSSLYRQFFSRNKQRQQKKLIIIYDTKQQIKTQYYETISVGRVVLGYERFITDFIDAMEVIGGEHKTLQTQSSTRLLPSDTPAQTPLQSLQANYPKLYALIAPKTPQTSTQETIDLEHLHQQQLQVIINEENTKMKENLKNISKLTEIIVDTNFSVVETTRYEIALSLQQQNNLIEEIQGNLLEISVIHEIVETNYKNSTRYKQLQPRTKQQIDKLSIGFYILFVYMNNLSKQTDSPMFGGRGIYHDWLRVVKQIKVENNELLFAKGGNIRQMQVAHYNQKQRKTQENTHSKLHQSKHQLSNQGGNNRIITSISSGFASNIEQLIKSLLIKLIKSIKWLRKYDLYNFLLMGIVVLQLTSYVNVVNKVEQLRELIVANISGVPYGDSVDAIFNKIQPKHFETISSLLNLLKTPKQSRSCLLIDALYTDNQKILYSPEIIKLYTLLEKNKIIQDLLKQVLTLKYDFQLIRVNKYEFKPEILSQVQIQSKTNLSKANKSVSEYLPLKLTLQTRESELLTPITIIEDNEQAIPQLLLTLKHRAKYYKREFLAMVYLQNSIQKMTQRIKQIYERGKVWVWWVNVGSQSNSGRWMQHLISESSKYPQSKYVKMFILLPKQQKSQSIQPSLSFDRYSVSKIVGDSTIDLAELLRSIVSIASSLQSVSSIQLNSSTSMNRLSLKSFNRQSERMLYEIYHLLVIGFKLLLSLKNKSLFTCQEDMNSFGESQLVWHFLNYIKTFQSFYSIEQLRCLPKSNALKYISNYLYFIDETYTLEKVKNYIQICEKLIQEGLDYPALEGKIKIKQPPNISNENHNTLIEYFTQQQLIPRYLTNNPDQPKDNTIINPIQTALYALYIDTISSSNKIYYQNTFLNFFLQDIHDVYKSIGLDLHQTHNASFYQNTCQQLFKGVKQEYRRFIETYIPILDMKSCNLSLSKQNVTIISPLQIYYLLLSVKYFMAKRQASATYFIQQNKKQTNSISSRPSQFKRENTISKDSKHNNEQNVISYRSMIEKVILGQYLIQPRSDDNYNFFTDSSAQLLPLTLSSITQYFASKKLQKCSFTLYLKHRQSNKQETLKRKGKNYHGDKLAILAISKKQLSNIIQNFVLVLDWSKNNTNSPSRNRKQDYNKETKFRSGLSEVCVLQVFMK